MLIVSTTWQLRYSFQISRLITLEEYLKFSKFPIVEEFSDNPEVSTHQEICFQSWTFMAFSVSLLLVPRNSKLIHFAILNQRFVLEHTSAIGTAGPVYGNLVSTSRLSVAGKASTDSAVSKTPANSPEEVAVFMLRSQLIAQRNLDFRSNVRRSDPKWRRETTRKKKRKWAREAFYQRIPSIITSTYPTNSNPNAHQSAGTCPIRQVFLQSPVIPGTCTTEFLSTSVFPTWE